MDGSDLPRVRPPVPGPRATALVDLLARHECPAITARRSHRASALGRDHDDPIVWARALGSNVWDVDDNRYVDLTSGFGVALVGHAHPAVVAAATAQTATLIHAMGDAFPDATRIALLTRLAAFAPGDLSVSILGLSGSDAIDAAVKTAILATGRTGILVFDGGYHGLALGVLPLQSARPAFNVPFADVAHPRIIRRPFGAPLADVAEVMKDIGLVLVEPIQGRGGIREAPDGWLAGLVDVAHTAGALIAFDEIQCGLGRTGVPFVGPAEGAVPDLMCVGKALAGGFPLSACIGTPEVMSAWDASTGEAIHTQTFLGHPVGCAAALAVLDLFDDGLLDRIQDRSAALEARLPSMRGRGLMRALPLSTDALAASRSLLAQGFVVLPADATSLQIVPPVTLTDSQIDAFATAVEAL